MHVIMKSILIHKPMLSIFILLLSVFLTACGHEQPLQGEIIPDKGMVILLHGLARSGASMLKMQRALVNAGFSTCNIYYPSTRHEIVTLATEYVLPKIHECVDDTGSTLNFVTHSLGGIIVRYLAKKDLLVNIGRVVMLAPPNQGSEVADVLGEFWLFKLINGPAGKELGTSDNSIPLQIGPANFEVGIIAGSKSINLILSLMIDGENDGKVSIKNTRLEGMKDFIVLPVTHPFIMKEESAIRQTIHFLIYGMFRKNST